MDSTTIQAHETPRSTNSLTEAVIQEALVALIKALATCVKTEDDAIRALAELRGQLDAIATREWTALLGRAARDTRTDPMTRYRFNSRVMGCKDHEIPTAEDIDKAIATAPRRDPWIPLPPIGTILRTTRTLPSWTGDLAPGTRVQVVDHVPATPDDGPSIRVQPSDADHPWNRVVSSIRNRVVPVSNGMLLMLIAVS